MNLVFESDRMAFRPQEEVDLDLVIEQWTDPDVAKYVAPKTYTAEELAADMRSSSGGARTAVSASGV